MIDLVLTTVPNGEVRGGKLKHVLIGIVFPDTLNSTFVEILKTEKLLTL